MENGKLVQGVKHIYRHFYEDEVLALGAQMAYNLILSFFPFLIFLTTLIGYSSISSQDLLDALSLMLPQEAYTLVQDTLREVVDIQRGGLLSFSAVTAVWFASNGVGAVINGLNKAYDEKETRSYWKLRGMYLLFTLILSITILFSFVLLVLGGVIQRTMIDGLGWIMIYQIIWKIGRYIFILTIIFLTFTALYLYRPNCRRRWREVVPGAVFSTISWLIVSMGFAYYVDNFGHYSVIYGSIGGVFILLMWLFFTAVIILLGGQVNGAVAFVNKS